MSILQTRLAPFSIVLIDDSHSGNFAWTSRFLRSLSLPFKHLSSSRAGQLVEETLRSSDLTLAERVFVGECTGLKSPFCGYVKRFLDLSKPELELEDCLRFAPYSVARNLGVFSAVKFFNPDIIVFLDDDCIVRSPEKLPDRLQLAEAELDRKRVVAVAGLYETLLRSAPSEDGGLNKMLSFLRGMDRFIEESFQVGEIRLKAMPPHILGGALILHSRAFRTVPFDPYVARGEDHSYAQDLKRYLADDEIVVRDSDFVVSHERGYSLETANAQKRMDLNVLRDIFRFAYIRRKTGRSFIRLFSVRWTLAALCSLLIHPSNYRQYEREIAALLFTAPKYATQNRSKFAQHINAWNKFLCQAEARPGFAAYEKAI